MNGMMDLRFLKTSDDIFVSTEADFPMSFDGVVHIAGEGGNTPASTPGNSTPDDGSDSGAGNDTGTPVLPADPAMYTIEGTAGNDVLTGTAEAEIIIGGKGDDTMTGGDGDDYFLISLGDGNDVIKDFDPAEDRIDLTGTGLAFEDLSSEETDAGLLISWDGGSLLLEGMSGDMEMGWFYMAWDGVIDEPNMPIIDRNLIEGSGDDDTLNGTDEADEIHGDAGNDLLSGGGAGDWLAGGKGDDTLTGGDNADMFVMEADGGDDIITDFTPGEDLIDMTSTGVSFSDLQIEETDTGTMISWDGGSLHLDGVTDEVDASWFMFMDPIGIGEPGVHPNEPAFILGGDDADVLQGTADQDFISGGRGDDTMTGGEGGDIFLIGEDNGDDVITDFNTEEDKIDLMATGMTFEDLTSEHTDEGLLVSWDGGGLLLEGVTEDLSEEWLYIGGGEDPVTGGVNLPGMELAIIDGSEDDDTLTAESDVMTNIFGYGGDDVITGSATRDYIEGGEGDDTITGGEGPDVFGFAGNSGNDVITDFDTEEDVLSFLDSAISFDDIQAESVENGTLIGWDGGSVLLVGVTGDIAENWFYFSSAGDDGVSIDG